MVGTFLVGVVVLTSVALGLAAIRQQRQIRAALAAQAEVTRLSEDLETSRRLLGQTDRLSAIGMLAASVAHEVRNPLVSVRTFVQLAPERLDDEEFRTSFRELALGEIDRICLLVNDLLAFARPSVAEVRATNINEILGQMRRLLDGEAKKCAVELSTDLDLSLPMLPVDEPRIKQVFLNVVLNAIQACTGGGSVAVATRAVQRAGTIYYQVEVRDSGCGIPPGALERIFDPFFTTKHRGSGLGLFIAQRIVRDHGGHVQVNSAPGSGTVFSLNFPLRETARAHTQTKVGAGGNDNDRSHRSLSHG